MAKGKYAARAANARVSEAQESVADLQARLAAERQDNKRLIAGLNAKIQTLQGQLVREVQALADVEVRRVEAEFAKQIGELRRERHDAGIAVSKLLEKEGVELPTYEAWGELARLLGITPGELLSVDGAARNTRRMSGRDLRHFIELHEVRGLDVQQLLSGPPGARH